MFLLSSSIPIKPLRELTTSQSQKEQVATPLFREAPISPVHQQSQPSQLLKSPSLQRQQGVHPLQTYEYGIQGSPELLSPHSPPIDQKQENGLPFEGSEKVPNSNKWHDSFEICLPSLPKLDINAIQRLSSGHSDPESPVSPLLTSDPKNERSHSKTFSRADVQYTEVGLHTSPSILDSTEKMNDDPPSLWRLAKLSSPEWLYAILGSIGAAIFGSFNPLLAFAFVQVVQNYYELERNEKHAKSDVNKWCLVVVGMGIVTVVANFLQHFYFGIMGEKMTERVRRMMFSGIHIISLII